MIIALALALATLQEPQVVAPATIDETLEVEGADIAARQVRTRMEVPVSIEGQGPFRFLVDSGADRTVIGATLAARLKLERSGRVMVNGMAGAMQSDTVRIGRLDLGGSVIEGIRAPALAEQYLGADGLIGIDALADQRLKIDFVRKIVTVQDSRAADRDAENGDIVVTARRRRGQLILTQALVGRTQTSAVIDTGAQISVGNSALRKALRLDRTAPAQRINLISVTGQTVPADLFYVDGILIGSLALDNVAVAFADVPPFGMFGLRETPALLLGTDVLQAFRRVSLDFRRRLVRFALR